MLSIHIDVDDGVDDGVDDDVDVDDDDAVHVDVVGTVVILAFTLLRR